MQWAWLSDIINSRTAQASGYRRSPTRKRVDRDRTVGLETQRPSRSAKVRFKSQTRLRVRDRPRSRCTITARGRTRSNRRTWEWPIRSVRHQLSLQTITSSRYTIITKTRRKPQGAPWTIWTLQAANRKCSKWINLPKNAQESKVTPSAQNSNTSFNCLRLCNNSKVRSTKWRSNMRSGSKARDSHCMSKTKRPSLSPRPAPSRSTTRPMEAATASHYSRKTWWVKHSPISSPIVISLQIRINLYSSNRAEIIL